MTVGRVARWVLTSVLAFSVTFPVLWMVLTSLKRRSEAVTWPPTFWPEQLLWTNYVEVWQTGAFFRWMLNSVIVSGGVVAGTLVLGIPAAFAFARLRFVGKEAMFFLVLATLMVPGELLLLPEFVILSRLGWIDTYFALIVPFMVNGFAIFLLRQFFQTIPRSIEDAAIIDGCSPIQLMYRIYVPLALPAVGVAAFMAFLGSWNSYLFPLVVTRSEEMRTMTVGLSLFTQEHGTDWPLLMTASTIIALPPVIVFLIFERRIVDALSIGGATD